MTESTKLDSFEPLWRSPSADLVLLQDVVHVWRADLNLPAWQTQQFATILSPDEQLRAERFYFERDRNHFIAGRGMLRAILSRYLNLQPAQLQFSYTSRGKPMLANPDTEGTVSFNLSHSNGLALYAIAPTPHIGIDLEYMRPMPEAEKLAKRFFSPREHAVISASPTDDQKQEAFFHAWTCKEAYLKAIGDGLPGLETVEVSLVPGEPAALLSIQGDQAAASRWSLYQLLAAPGYIAAVAVEGKGCHLDCWQFE
jgi:4'-phosphopantetheinyl transferase